LKKLNPAAAALAVAASLTGMVVPAASARAAAPTVKVWFTQGERLVAVKRVQRSDGGLGDALQQLVKGPTQGERKRSIRSNIPRGTRLLAVTGGKGAVVTVDLTKRFESGGGTASMTARIAQLVYTATGFKSVRAVRIALNGRLVTHIGGEGIDVSRPLTRADVRH
jgi:spore germination protein GerM